MSIVFLGIIFFSQLSLIMNSFIINNHYIIKFNTNSKEQFQTDELKTSDDNLKYIIVSFNTSSFNGEIKTNFTNYGGIITNEWNNTFSSFSGFAGSIPEVNFTNFKNNCPKPQISQDFLKKAIFRASEADQQVKITCFWRCSSCIVLIIGCITPWRPAAHTCERRSTIGTHVDSASMRHRLASMVHARVAGIDTRTCQRIGHPAISW